MSARKRTIRCQMQCPHCSGVLNLLEGHNDKLIKMEPERRRKYLEELVRTLHVTHHLGKGAQATPERQEANFSRPSVVEESDMCGLTTTRSATIAYSQLISELPPPKDEEKLRLHVEFQRLERIIGQNLWDLADVARRLRS